MKSASKSSKEQLFIEIKSDFQKFTKNMRIINTEMKQEENQYFEDYFLIIGSVKSLLAKSVIYLIFITISFYYAFLKSTMYSMEWTMLVGSCVVMLFLSPAAFYIMFIRDALSTMIKQYLLVTGSALIGFLLLLRVHTGACLSDDFTQTWHCNPQATSYSLPQDLTMLLMLLPIADSSIWGEIRIDSIFSSWAIVVLSLVVSVIYGGAYNSITTVVFYAPISFLVLYEQRRQFLSNYFYMRRLEQTRQQSEEQTVRAHPLYTVHIYTHLLLV